jgi:hypothetical protein
MQGFPTPWLRLHPNSSACERTALSCQLGEGRSTPTNNPAATPITIPASNPVVNMRMAVHAPGGPIAHLGQPSGMTSEDVRAIVAGGR